MTDDNSLNSNIWDSAESDSIIPPESTAEEALAAAANAIPAMGGPIVVDPYSVLGQQSPTAPAVRADSIGQPYVAPNLQTAAAGSRPSGPGAAAQYASGPVVSSGPVVAPGAPAAPSGYGVRPGYGAPAAPSAPGAYAAPAGYGAPAGYRAPGYGAPTTYATPAPYGYGYPGQPFAPRPPADGMGIAAMVLGILGVIFMWVPVLGAILAILGLVLGLVSLSHIRARGTGGRGLAITGVVTGAVGLLFGLWLTIAILSSPFYFW